MAPKDKAQQAEPEAPAADGEEQGGLSRKKLILIGAAAALLLVLAGAGGAVFFLTGDDSQAEAELAGPAGEEQAATPPERDGTYYVMEPEFIVGLAPDSRFRTLQTKIEVYSSNPDLLAQLKKHDPMLRHHLSNVFATKASQDLLDREGRERLKEEVKAEIESKLSKIGVRDARIDDLFFTQFVME